MKHQFIEKYCNEYLLKNVWFIEQFATLVQKIKPKDIEFDEIASLLALVKPKAQDAAQERVPPDISYMEALVVNFGDDAHPGLECIREKVTSDMYKLLNILLFKTKNKERRNVENILTYLFSMRQLSLDDISYPEIACIKTGKNDLIWYLWKIVLVCMADHDNNNNMASFIKSNLAIFVCAYQKKHRQTRIKIIYHVFNTLCKYDSLPKKELQSKNNHHGGHHGGHHAGHHNNLVDYDYLSFLPLKNMTII